MRPHPALVELAAGRALPPVHDHDEVARSALEHRMGGLLWSAVRDDATWPPTCRERLAGADLVVRRRHQELWSAFAALSRTLGAEGIRVATFKGVAAEHRWYDRLGARPCNDLDLLLDPSQLDRVDEIVALVEPGHALRDRVGTLVQKGLLQSVELRTATGTSVDLHVDLFKLWLPSPRDAVWGHTVSLTAPDGTSVRAVDAPMSLVHFLVHLTKDRFRWLLGYADVARVLRDAALDRDAAARIARDAGVDVHYALGLDTVVRTLGIDEPVPAPPRARGAVWSTVWRPSIRLRGDEGVIRFRQRQIWVTLLARGRVADKARFLRRKALPPAELAAYRRPGAASYFQRVTAARVADAVRRWRATRDVR